MGIPKLWRWGCTGIKRPEFPSRSINRLGLLIECSRLTCFAREKAAWFGGGEIDDRRRLLSGQVWRGENRSRTTCPNSENEEKTISTHEFESRRVQVRQPNSKLHQRNAQCTHQRMQCGLALDRSCSSCSTATSPTWLCAGFFVGLKDGVA